MCHLFSSAVGGTLSKMCHLFSVYGVIKYSAVGGTLSKMCHLFSVYSSVVHITLCYLGSK
jgi:hypothetical protein